MTHDRLEALLRDRIGLAIESIGRASLDLAIAARAKVRGIRNPREYAVIAATDPAEWDELVEQLVVPETWFFRGHATFELLRDYASRLRLPRPSAATRPQLRMLSLPCSTGEEPYSMVMACLDQGWAPDQLVVDAIDLSRRALEAAASGEFTLRSFRETTPAALAAQTHYFDRDGANFRLHERVRTVVRFRQANAAGPLVFGDGAPYDVICCRNLLIYLHDEARRRLCGHLHSLLRPGGLLFVGHAEPMWQLDPRFEIAPPVGAFAYTIRTIQRSQPGESPIAGPDSAARPADGIARDVNGATNLPDRIATSFEPRPDFVPVPTTDPMSVSHSQANSATLDQAEAAADQGDMGSAERLCREYLAANRPSARAWCLLGVVLQAGGRTEEARPCFERAVYLEPDHLESLTHLMLDARVAGDTISAENYLRRLERIGRRPFSPPAPAGPVAPRRTGVRR